MLFWAHIVGGAFLMIEAFLGWLAFGAFNTAKTCPEGFSECKVQELYNENFLSIPVIGPIANFYPMLNATAVPILLITLRNNLFEGLGMARGLERIGCPKALLNMQSFYVKGFWSFILQIPVFIICCFYRNPQVMLTYTGGLCGAFILMIIPMISIDNARRKNIEAKYGRNPYQSFFTSRVAFWFVGFFCSITLITVIYQIYQQIADPGADGPGDPCEAQRPAHSCDAKQFWDL